MSTLITTNGNITNVNTGTIKDATGNTTAMTVDSSGRVSRSVIPAWRVGLVSNQTHSANSSFDITFDKTSGDGCFIQGGCTISSGVVTVPIAGIYQVSANIRMNNVNANYIELYLRVNSSGTDRFYAIEGNPYEPYHSVCVSGALSLNASDNVKVHMYAGGDTSHSVNANHLTSFTGVMIG